MLIRPVAALTVAAYAMTFALPARAHNGTTHQEIVSTAWQVMRAASDPEFTTNVFGSGAPPSGVVSLREPGDCGSAGNRCGQIVNQAAWTNFVLGIRGSLDRVNAIKVDFGTAPGCLYQGTERLKDFPDALAPGHTSVKCVGESCSDEQTFTNCDTFRRNAGAPAFWRPSGIYDLVNGRRALATDGRRFQGLALGHASKSGDDHLGDTESEYALPIVAQALRAAGTAYEFALTAIFIPFVCAWLFLSGSDEDCVDRARQIADNLNFVDFLIGLLPGIGGDRDGTLATLWHFINGLTNNDGEPAGENQYDDRRGMYYPEAGPQFCVGAVDQAIMVWSHTTEMRINAEEDDETGVSASQGTERYELTSGEIGNNRPSDDRDVVDWQMEFLGNLQFSPLDNFAGYGSSQFRANDPRASWLAWPLHAIGDASVPHHAVPTSSWGHRPYEDVVANYILDDIFFQGCSTLMVDRGQAEQCHIDDQTKLAANTNTKAEQFKQAHRILEHAFFWTNYLASHDVRDLVRELALQTADLALLPDPSASTLSREPSPLFCEWCSLDYHVIDQEKTGVLESLGIQLFSGLACADTGNPGWMILPKTGWTDYYQQPTAILATRELIERAVGATIAYLGKQSSGICKATAASCTASSECCDGTCSGGRCCFADSSPCAEDGDCCTGICNATKTCAATRCANVGASCSSASQCCSGICTNGTCGAPPCAASLAACTVDSDCCSGGLCLGGKCQPSQCVQRGSSCQPSDVCCGTNICVSGMCTTRPPPVQ